MEINITKNWENSLLDRKEITFNVSHTGATPSRDEIKNKLVAQLNSQHELVIVDKIGTEYGTQNTSGYAKIYSDVERANEIENKYVLKRNELKPVEEPEAAEEATTEEPVAAEEATTEEPVAAEEATTEEPVAAEEEATTEEPITAEEATTEEPEAEEKATTEEPVAAEEAASEEEPAV